MKKLYYRMIAFMAGLLSVLLTAMGCSARESFDCVIHPPISDAITETGMTDGDVPESSETLKSESSESRIDPMESESSARETGAGDLKEPSQAVLDALEMLRVDASVTVSSGRSSIHPLSGLVYTVFYDETSGCWLNGCGMGVYMYQEAWKAAGATSADAAIPCMTLDGAVSVLLPEDGTVEAVSVIDLSDPSYQAVKTTLEGLQTLPAGEYDVILRVVESENLGGNQPQEETCEEKLFRLYVGYAHFSFEADQAAWGDQPVITEGFVNTEENPILHAEDAVRLAKREATVTYDAVTVAHDTARGVWRVLFYTSAFPGGCQTVYIEDSGRSVACVYGE
jgi:hypothetical protein